MSTDPRHIAITKGDSKHDLYAQAYDWGRPYPERKVFLLTLIHLSFPTRREELVVATHILGIKEAHSGDSEFDSDSEFSLTGIISLDKNHEKYGYEHPWLEDFLEEFFEFKAYYDTRTRKGTMRPQ